MGDAIGQLLPFALGVTISPMPIIAVVLMLVTPQARANGLAFLLGWALGIALAGAIFLSLAGPASSTDDGDPATWVSWLKLLLGALLMLVAARQWQQRPAAGEDVPMPKWMGMLDGITPVKAAGLAVFLGTLNPKNLLLIIGGAAAAAATSASGSDLVIAWGVFTLIASIGVLAPLVIYFIMGDRAAAILTDIKTWMAHNNVVIMAVLCLVIGVKLIGDAISGLSS